MNATGQQIAKFAKRPVAAFMALWLSGFLFLFCCDMPSKAAASEHCPLKNKSEHCSKGTKNKSLPNLSGGSEDKGLICCVYLQVAFDKARKIDQQEKAAVVSVDNQLPTPDFQASAISFPVQFFYSPPIRYREKVFITNRVLRI